MKTVTFKYEGEDFTLELTDKFEKAFDLMENTDQSFFVTGKAGSGKSSLLKYFRAETKKSVAVVAFTGLAAINVQGQTIHSFFGFPLGFIHQNAIKLKEDMIALLKSLDTIIIDEISMLRADLMDAIDKSLRIHRGSEKPFGGCQMIFIGDLYQLPPIIEKELADVYGKYYLSPYFFSADVFNKMKLPYINLDKIHRQNDPEFIEILNSVRERVNLPKALEKLNRNVEYNFKDIKEGETVVLSTTNEKVREINTFFLSKINLPEQIYSAFISGEFDPKSYPTEEKLLLKEGAKVMFVKNDPDHQYVNGDIGIITKLTPFSIEVKVKGSNIQVKTQRWEKMAYKYVPSDNVNEKGSVQKTIVGEFHQYPLRLAWAITIHKCIEENQLIKTKLGWKSIKLIEIGDEVLTDDLSYKTVINKFDSGVQDIYEIKTRFGYSLIGTALHPLKTNEKWKLIKDYVCGDKISLVMDNNNHNFKLNDIGYLLGYLVGDGSYSCYDSNDKSRIEIVVHDKGYSNIRQIREILNRIKVKYSFDKKIKNRNVVRFRIHNKNFREKLLMFGLNCVKSPNKDIPNYIMLENMIIKSSFIRGLFDSDGSCNENQIRFVNTSYSVITKLQLLLNEFGIGSTINSIKKSKLTKNQAYVLRIVTNDNLKFKNKIGFNDYKKTKFLNKLIKKYSKPIKSEFYKIYKNEDINQLAKKCGFLKKIYPSKIFVHSKLLKSLLDKADLMKIAYPNYLKYYSNNQFIEDEIISIKSIGKGQTYDIEVDENHSFISQGFICHNSQGQTYNSVFIDMHSGSFTSGQTYVALSRCRELNGIRLQRAITERDVILDKRITEFSRTFEQIV